jgi:hypothetical protein
MEPTASVQNRSQNNSFTYRVSATGSKVGFEIKSQLQAASGPRRPKVVCVARMDVYMTSDGTDLHCYYSLAEH